MSATIKPTPSGVGAGNFAAALTPIYNLWQSVINNNNTTVTGSFAVNQPDMFPLCIATAATSWASVNSVVTQQAWDQGVQWQIAPEELYPNPTNGTPFNSEGIISEARCVGAGLRITFSGNYSTTDGVIYAAVIPKNAIVPFWYFTTGGEIDESTSIVTAPRNFSEVLSTLGVQAFAAQGGLEAHWVPEDPQSVTFTQVGKDCARRKTQIAATTVSGGSSNEFAAEQLNAIPSIFVWGTNLNANASFVVEATGIFEATLAPGLSAFLQSEPSPVDPIGFGKALRVAAMVPTAKPSPSNYGGALAQSGAMSTLRGVGKDILRSGASMIAGRVGGKVAGLAMKGLSGLLSGLSL
jgi:hypothetical protein